VGCFKCLCIAIIGIIFFVPTSYSIGLLTAYIHYRSPTCEIIGFNSTYPFRIILLNTIGCTALGGVLTIIIISVLLIFYLVVGVINIIIPHNKFVHKNESYGNLIKNSRDDSMSGETTLYDYDPSTSYETDY
jgi:hypothetical protein